MSEKKEDISNPHIDLALCQLAIVSQERFPLVDRFYVSCKYRVKCGRFDRVYCLTRDDKIIAAARLLPQRSGELLLRNLCVLPELRRQGVAGYFMRALLTAIVPHNCYCFALPHLRDFYLALNFKLLEPGQVPSETALLAVRYRERKRDWLLMGFARQSE
jgi:N-acetylglutamate synthase-like GNAT family acetyltransferase